MEPSSTPFCRAGALLAIIALASLAGPELALARGFAGIGRVQAIRVVPRAPVQSGIASRTLGGGHLAAAPNNSLVQHRNSAFIRHGLHRRLFGGAAVALSGPYGSPYAVDTSQPSPSQIAAAEAIEPMVVPFEGPACVRPLIIQIKPVQRAAHLPRVIYGRPPPC
jgi:hypothetical protein